MPILEIVLSIVSLYLVFGIVFAIPFVVRGAEKIDEGAQGATWGFRLIIIPGAAVFWPLLLRKWIRAGKKTDIHKVAKH